MTYSKNAEFDKFYTPDGIALKLTRKALEVIPDWRERRFIEPAAGGGAFVRAFQDCGITNFEAADLSPDAGIDFECLEQDFLALEPVGLFGGVSLEGAVVVTNPPFGSRSKLSIAFFNKAAELGAEYICLLTTRNSKKHSVYSRYDKNYELLSQEDLLVNFIYSDGSPYYIMKAIFQVWKLTESPRIDRKVDTGKYFKKIRIFEDFINADLWVYISRGQLYDDFSQVDIPENYTAKVTAIRYKHICIREEIDNYKIIDNKKLALNLIALNLINNRDSILIKKLWPLIIHESRESGMLFNVHAYDIAECLDEYYEDPEGTMAKVEALTSSL